MGEMGYVGETAFPGNLGDGDIGVFRQQLLGLDEADAQYVGRGGLARGFLDAAVELAGADAHLGSQGLDIHFSFPHVLMEYLGKQFEQLLVAAKFYAHGCGCVILRKITKPVASPFVYLAHIVVFMAQK